MKIKQLHRTTLGPAILMASVMGLVFRCTVPAPKLDAGVMRAVDQLVNQAIQDSLFPGAVLLVGHRSDVLYEKSYGRYDYALESQPMSLAAVFDLASVTKVMATTVAVMRLYEEGEIDLDAHVADYIPPFAQTGKGHVTFRHLLVHESGFPPGKPFYRFCRSEEEAYDSLYAMPLAYPTGTKTVYSDLGFITLGRLVEVVSGVPLEEYVSGHFYQPLGMTSTAYNPPAGMWPNIAPTEPEHNYRLTNRPGSAKNRITQLMNGVAGHAGLFSTARDLSKVAVMLLQEGTYQGQRYFRESTIQLFTGRQSEQSSRGLGWDTGNGEGKHRTGHYFSAAAFGHTGFTGTSVWIDPEHNLFIIFLSNRTYQMKDRTRMYSFRPLLHDKIMEAIGQA